MNGNYGRLHHTIGLLQLVREGIRDMTRFLAREWPEAESYWLPLLQDLQFLQLKIPESIQTYEWTVMVAAINWWVNLAQNDVTAFNR